MNTYGHLSRTQGLDLFSTVTAKRFGQYYSTTLVICRFRFEHFLHALQRLFLKHKVIVPVSRAFTEIDNNSGNAANQTRRFQWNNPYSLCTRISYIRTPIKIKLSRLAFTYFAQIDIAIIIRTHNPTPRTVRRQRLHRSR